MKENKKLRWEVVKCPRYWQSDFKDTHMPQQHVSDEFRKAWRKEIEKSNLKGDLKFLFFEENENKN